MGSACDSEGVDPVGIVLLLMAIGVVAALMAVTAIGQRRRGARLGIVVLAGVLFPFAWVGWYAHDELPKR